MLFPLLSVFSVGQARRVSQGCRNAFKCIMSRSTSAPNDGPPIDNISQDDMNALVSFLDDADDEETQEQDSDASPTPLRDDRTLEEADLTQRSFEKGQVR